MSDDWSNWLATAELGMIAHVFDAAVISSDVDPVRFSPARSRNKMRIRGHNVGTCKQIPTFKLFELCRNLPRDDKIGLLSTSKTFNLACF